MRRCEIDGCDGKHMARGWCSRHYARWRYHGDPISGSDKPEEEWFCTCAEPLDLSPIGECQRCHRAPLASLKPSTS